MKTELNIICPISSQKVNSWAVRIIAILIALIVVLAIALNNTIFSAFLVLDFFSRAFLGGKGSVLKLLSLQLVKKFQLTSKLIDAAPKAFAAKIGFVFSVIILFSQLLNWTVPANCFAIVLILCALLEGIFEICLGCYFYTIVLKINQKYKY